MDDIDNIDNTDNTPIQKPKRTLNEQQKANLAKGRELGRLRLKEKSNKVKEEKQQATDELQKLQLANSQLKNKAVIKKANELIKEKLKIKKTLDVPVENEDSDEEEIIIPIQPKKPKKKKVIYLPPESDSEEEIVYKKPPSKPKKRETVVEAPEPQIPIHKIVFY